MLTGLEIKRQVELGGIIISPFNIEQLNPNSYDVLLGDKLIGYKCTWYPVKTTTPVGEIVTWQEASFDQSSGVEIEIASCGHLISPDFCYIASIQEWIESPNHVPCIDGKSTLGRKFVQVHQTAGFGDIGFKGQFTLEITTRFPFLVFPGMRIAQVYFEEPVGDTSMKYSGKYQWQSGPTPARG